MSTLARIELDGQYRALREDAGFLERPRGTFVVTGPDAADFLQGQLTNDVEALEPGAGCYAALLDRKGHMQTDLRVLRIAPGELRLDCEADAAEVLHRHLGMYRIGRDLELSDQTASRALISVLGPSAAVRAGTGPLTPEHAHREISLGAANVRAVATDQGVDLLCERAEVDVVTGALEAAGTVPVTEEAAEILRVESGRPRFGREMTGETIPEEAGINERAVSFTKGCYIGQETVARLHYKGKPNRHLRGLVADQALRAGDPIALGDREVGRVGTAVLSPVFGPVALAIIRREAEPGARVVVGDAGVGAKVVEVPLVPGT